MGYSVVHADELEGEGRTGVIRFIRRRLEVEAFGINWFVLPPGAAGAEHHEIDTEQEEVNVVVAGHGIWRVDGEEVPVRFGTFLRFDPEQTRQPVAGAEGMTFVSVGARRGSYEPHGPF